MKELMFVLLMEMFAVLIVMGICKTKEALEPTVNYQTLVSHDGEAYVDFQ